MTRISLNTSQCLTQNYSYDRIHLGIEYIKIFSIMSAAQNTCCSITKPMSQGFNPGKKANKAISSIERQSVPFQQLQVLLSLFSEFFSSFPCGTCALSVSHSYLVFGGVYHPL